MALLNERESGSHYNGGYARVVARGLLYIGGPWERYLILASFRVFVLLYMLFPVFIFSKYYVTQCGFVGSERWCVLTF